ncbi:MAG: XdhC family protein [Hyphomicrobium sp.]
MQSNSRRAVTAPAGPQLSTSFAGLLADEDVLAPMLRWLNEGQRVALVTLASVEGGAPRQPGSQMAVAADGRYAGYLSGGCLEQAVALEAQAAIAEGRNRLVRYGEGSPYFDIQLPCGSGLDLYFDQTIDRYLLSEMMARRTQRGTFALHTNLSTGTTAIEDIASSKAVPQSRRDGDMLATIYAPALRLLLIGNGPALAAMAALASATGIELTIHSDDEPTRDQIAATGLEGCLRDLGRADAVGQLDFASAAVLFFHAHDQEPDLLERLLRTPSFYIGALGNHAVHRERLELLTRRGFAQSDLSRIRAPVGLIAGAKSKATLAVGVLAELMTEAKARNLIC